MPICQPDTLWGALVESLDLKTEGLFSYGDMLVLQDVYALLSQEELDRVPILYRWTLKLLLRFPNLGFQTFILRRFPEVQGIFWAILVPALLILYFLVGFSLVLFLSYSVSFPFNVLIGLLIPAFVFVAFLRIQLERTVAWWRSLQSPTKEWDISRVTAEFIEILKKQQAKKNNAD